MKPRMTRSASRTGHQMENLQAVPAKCDHSGIVSALMAQLASVADMVSALRK